MCRPLSAPTESPLWVNYTAAPAVLRQDRYAAGRRFAFLRAHVRPSVGCDRGPERRAPARPLFEAYTVHAKKTGVRHPMFQAAFGRCLEERRFRKERKNTGVFRLGLGLKPAR